jgi:hypothetical protein
VLYTVSQLNAFMALRCTEAGGTREIKRSVQCTEIGIEGFFLYAATAQLGPTPLHC